MKIYIGSQQKASKAATGTITTSGNSLFIGCRSPAPNEVFKGKIDEVRIWRNALAATQLDDMTPPAITSTNEGQTYLLNQVVAANGAATDGGTGVASVTTSVANLDTSTVGTHTFTVTATDYAKNTATKTVTYYVKYGFNGLLAPYAPPDQRAFKVGSSVPLKWQYTDSTGNVVDSPAAAPVVNIVRVGSGIGGSDETIVVEDPGLSGLRYDVLTMTWQYNWQTKGLSAGLYSITITSSQAQQGGPIPIQLRK
jgi:hypothetical protein